MSLNNTEPMREDIYSRFIHPLLSLASPFCVLTTINSTLQDLTAFPQLRLTWFHHLLLLTVGIIKIIINMIFRKERISLYHYIRELILLMAACYVILSLTASGPLKIRFNPGPHNIYPAIMILAQWIFTFRLHHLFHNKELFYPVIKDKQGKQLVTELRKTAILGTDAYNDMLRINRQLVFQGILLFTVMLIVALCGQPFSRTTLLWTGIFLLVSFLSAAVINQFQQEYTDLREGIGVPPGVQRRRIYVSGLFIACCLILGLCLAGNKALLSLPEFQRERVTEQGLAQESPQLPESPPLHNPLAELDTPQSNWPSFIMNILQIFIRILKYLLMGGGILILFLPFFSRTFRRWLGSKNFFRFLSRHLRRLLGYLKLIWQDLRDFIHTLQLRRQLKQLTSEKESGGEKPAGRAVRRKLQKRLQTNSIVRLFVRIIRWGYKNGHKYHFSQTAQEYIRELCSENPALISPLRESVRIFEKALFSDKLLTGDEIRIYKESVFRVLRSP